jgi:PKD domain
VNSRASYFLLALLGALALAAPAAAHDGGGEGALVVHSERIGGGERVQVSQHTDELQGAPSLKRAASLGRSGASALPASWCGAERTSDDRAHSLTTLPQVKVIYAHALGQPDRFATFGNHAQTDVGGARANVLAAAGGARTIRFDLGTSCGARYVDVQSVALPHPLSWYGPDAETASIRLENDVKPIVAAGSSGVRDYMVYADGVQPTGGVTGIAELVTDDRPGPTNASNLGGLWAFIFGNGTEPWRGETFLHETTHLLGGVQPTAPHATQAGHCFDQEDVMCYDDGSLSPWPDVTPCPGLSRYDCNADDYFAPHPAAGSYLATHWNVFNSVLTCPAAECDRPQPNTPPRASFTITSGGVPVTRVRVGQAVTFDGRASSDAEGPVLFAWDLNGDGATDANEPVLWRRFSRAGRWTVRLRVSDKAGAVAIATRTLTVLAAPKASPRAPVGARLKAALANTVRFLRKRHLHGLARRRHVGVAFRAPERGRLALRVSAARRRVAAGARTWRVPGEGRLSTRVTRAARPLLRRRVLHLRLTLSFRDARGRTTRRSASVALRR